MKYSELVNSGAVTSEIQTYLVNSDLVSAAIRIPYFAHIGEFEIDGAKCFNVNDGQLIVCFDEQVDTSVIERIAQEKPIYAVFRDASFADDSVAAIFEGLFETYSSDTIRRVI